MYLHIFTRVQYLIFVKNISFKFLYIGTVLLKIETDRKKVYSTFYTQVYIQYVHFQRRDDRV